MKIIMKKTVLVTGKHASPGDVLDISDKEARYLIIKGKAETYTEPVKAKKMATPVVPKEKDSKEEIKTAQKKDKKTAAKAEENK